MTSYSSNAKYARAWKGKARAIDPANYTFIRRADPIAPQAGGDGVVLPLTLIQASSYSAVYTLPIQVGTSDHNQTLSVQVDSGSSDLWIASNSCGSSACKQTGGNLYDPSYAKSTGQNFQITYVEGEASGPIVWDQVDIGGYTVDTQAVAAASTVDDEPLSTDFSGVLGIALPSNSIIASVVPPTTGNAPDGAVFTSNLFTMTPSSTAPSARFLSLSLARPEDNGGGTKSQLGIGKHPPEIVTDPSKVQYDDLSVPSGTIPYFWQAQLNGISVWVDGVEKVVDIGKSAKYPSSLPTAIIDSGMPVILTSRDMANALYGALGIGPGSDGQYYISCTQPVNMSITLDKRTAIPLHPLDLTAGASGNCMGMVQAYPAGSSVTEIGDIVLGVPFMRSAYTVMAYDSPDAHGIFPNASQLSRQSTHPRLGFLGLTDPTKALDEFHTVRVLNQPLTTGEDQSSGSSGGGGSSSGASQKTAKGSGKKLSVGLEVLIGIIGFFFLCFALFGVRWAVHRRKLAKMQRQGVIGRDRSGSWDSEVGGSKEAEGGVAGRGEGGKRGEYIMQQQAALKLVRQSTMSSPYGLSEDTLRGSKGSRYEELKKVDSSSTGPRSDVESLQYDDSARTRVGDAAGARKDRVVSLIETEERESSNDRELGFRPGQRPSLVAVTPADFDGREGDMGTWTMGNDTLNEPRKYFYSPVDAQPGDPYHNLPVRDEYPRTPRTPYHSHASSVDAGVAMPLLAHTRDDSLDDQGAARRAPLGHGRPPSRARVGSFGADPQGHRSSSSEFALADIDPSFDIQSSRTSMAGVGRSRIASLYQPPMSPPQHIPSSSSIPAPPPMSPPPLMQLSPPDDMHDLPTAPLPAQQQPRENFTTP